MTFDNKRKLLCITDDEKIFEKVRQLLPKEVFSVSSATFDEASENINDQNLKLVIYCASSKCEVELAETLQNNGKNQESILIISNTTIKDGVDCEQNFSTLTILESKLDKELLNSLIKLCCATDILGEEIYSLYSFKEANSIVKKLFKYDIPIYIETNIGLKSSPIVENIVKENKDNFSSCIKVDCKFNSEKMIEEEIYGLKQHLLNNNKIYYFDNVECLSINMQKYLQETLQENSFLKRKHINFSSKIIYSANGPLSDKVKNKKFILGLYLLINPITVNLTKIWESQDKYTLIDQVINILEEKYKLKFNIRKIDKDFIKKYYSAGLNQICNVVLIIGSGALKCSDLNFEEDTRNESNNLSLQEHEFNAILKALDNYNGCRKQTANNLGISERTLRNKILKMKSNGLDVPIIRKNRKVHE